MTKILFSLLIGCTYLVSPGHAVDPDLVVEARNVTTSAKTTYSRIVFYGGADQAQVDLRQCTQYLIQAGRLSKPTALYLYDIVSTSRTSDLSNKSKKWLECYKERLQELTNKLSLFAEYRQGTCRQANKPLIKPTPWKFDHWRCKNS